MGSMVISPFISNFQKLEGVNLLNSLTNVNGKSFAAYNYDKPLRQINIFFGTNGSGKSSLSGWLARCEPDSSRLFDTQYVNSRIRTRDKIEGVQILVGRQVSQDTEIEVARRRIKELGDDLVGLHTQQDQKRALLVSNIEQAFSAGRKQFDTTRIKQKQNLKQDPVKALGFWMDEIHPHGGLQVDNSQQLEERQQALETQRAALPTKLDDTQLEILANLQGLLQTPVTVPSEITGDNLRIWLEEGMKLHDMSAHDEVCQFCGNRFDATETASQIHHRLDQEHSKTLSSLRHSSEALQQTREIADKLKQILGEDDSGACREIIDMTKQLDVLIDRKRENTLLVLDGAADLPAKLHGMNKQIDDTSTSIAQQLHEAQRMLDNIESMAKSWIGSRLKEDGSSSQLASGISTDAKQIGDLEKQRQHEEAKLHDLESKDSQLQPFAAVVNRVFAGAGIRFKLAVSMDGRSYALTSVDDHGTITASDLSEGEIRLLGFLHFYYSLFTRYDSTNKTFDPSVKTIILDDPITSLDTDNRFYIIEQINSLIDDVIDSAPDRQMFLLTNSEYDFHSFAYHTDKQKTLRSIIYKSMQGDSMIREVTRTEFKNYSDYYKSEFQEIIQFAVRSPDRVQDEPACIQYGNKMRFVFESHARTHYNIEDTTAKALTEIKRCYGFPDSWNMKVSRSLDIINALSHGMSWTNAGSSRQSIREVQQAIRCMVSVLNNKDHQHVLAMWPQGCDQALLGAWANNIAQKTTLSKSTVSDKQGEPAGQEILTPQN